MRLNRLAVKKWFWSFAATAPLSLQGESSLFHDLSIVEEISKEQRDQLPFFYNSSLVGGYFVTPSARMNPSGTFALGASFPNPYQVYSLAFQYFDRIETSVNYRILSGIEDSTFGSLGFGDDSERSANLKIAAILPSDGWGWIPSFAFGADDFIGSKRFNSQYVVMTKEWTRHNVEASLGFGRHRMRRFFGGIAWTPLRQTNVLLLKNLSFIGEYDPIDYKNHPNEHPKGRSVKHRINLGGSLLFGNTLQLSAFSLRGNDYGITGSLRYPLGDSPGFFAKTDNPQTYRSPVDLEPLGLIRTKKEFAYDLAYKLGGQGLDLYQVHLQDASNLWIKIINNSYRTEEEVRSRLERVLGALTPEGISSVTVVIEAYGVLAQSYHFRSQDLYRFRERKIGSFEMETLASMQNPIPEPKEGESLFQRRKPIWLFTIEPRFLSFFGSASGKFKYNVGLTATPEGYLFDEVYYELQGAYSIHSTMWNMSSVDRLNPSQLPNVRTDSIDYFKDNTLSLTMAYVQKNWALPKGWYSRASLGYFEPAYAGGALEFLYYPVGSSFAIGIEEATLLKRKYHGIGFTTQIRKLEGYNPTYEHFIGEQFFLDLYYEFKPLDLTFKGMIGQFLAKDRGAKLEMTRWFKSGLYVSLWYTWTNGHDHLNGATYHDKGFAFGLPLDFFMKKSSRSYLGYAMSAWLRDIGAVGDTGRRLYETLYLERR